MRDGLLAALCCLAITTPAAAAVTVEFVAPGGYSDANIDSRYRGAASPSVLHQMESHLVRLGRLYLSPNESLKIQILDIDLAGEIERPPGASQDIRVLRSATWPRINLRYLLERNGKILREAQEVVTDPGYLFGATAIGPSGTLYYEKRMLDDWFRRRFAR